MQDYDGTKLDATRISTLIAVCSSRSRFRTIFSLKSVLCPAPCEFAEWHVRSRHASDQALAGRPYIVGDVIGRPRKTSRNRFRFAIFKSRELLTELR